MDLLYERIGATGFESLTPSERFYFALWWFFAETNNGGLEQFFTNSAGELAHDALRGLQTINAPATESVLRRAMSLFPHGKVTADRDSRIEIILSLSPDDRKFLDELDREFYDNNTDVADALAEYVEANPEEFPSFGTSE